MAHSDSEADEEDVEVGDAFDFDGDGRSSEVDDVLNEEDLFDGDEENENADVDAEEGTEHGTEHGEETGSEDEDEEMEAEGEEEEEEEEESMDVQKEEDPLPLQQGAAEARPIPEVPSPGTNSAAVERRSKLVPSILNGRSYTVEAIVAIAQPEATHSLAASTCMTHLLTGSEDGYVRDYDVYGAVNGKTYLSAPQRAHCGIVEGTMKAGVMRMWWENGSRGSAVTALAMQSDGLWALAGTDKGQVNLFTVRHEPGQFITGMEGHQKWVSSLALTEDEKGYFSGGWDGDVHEWDLNTGQQVRKFTTTTSSGAQIAVVAVRPSSASDDDDGRSEVSYDPLFDDDDDNDDDGSHHPQPHGSFSPNVLLTASIDGSIVLWDRRVINSVGKLESSTKTPPWCVSACWSADGAQIYAGRRNSTVDVWDSRHFGVPRLLKTLRNPSSSGAVSSVAAFPDGRHIAVASNDNIRLWNASDADSVRGRSGVPFKIIPGHHGGIISQILIDPAARFMVSASSNRGWGTGESTRVVLIHDIKSYT